MPLTAYWVDQNFTKMCAVLCVQQIEASHTGSTICAKFESMLSKWNIEKSNVCILGIM